MKKLILCLVLFTGASLLVSGTASAQAVMAGDEMFIEMLKHDVRQARTEVVTNVMQFSAEDAAAFWPVYKEYQAELNKLTDKRVALVKEYAAVYWSITNPQAEELAEKWFEHQKDRPELLKRYYAKFAEALSPAQALKVIQLEHRLNVIIDMQMANELPMLE